MLPSVASSSHVPRLTSAPTVASQSTTRPFGLRQRATRIVPLAHVHACNLCLTRAITASELVTRYRRVIFARASECSTGASRTRLSPWPTRSGGARSTVQKAHRHTAGAETSTRWPGVTLPPLTDGVCVQVISRRVTEARDSRLNDEARTDGAR